MATAVKNVNQNADVVGKANALMMNIGAAKGLMMVLRSNLGPRGTLKMLVGGAGQIKITKDGKVLLHEMQIQLPTAALIARTATAQDEITGDGTTSTVLLVGEMLKRAEMLIAEGLHPRTIVDGFDLAKEHVQSFLANMKESKMEIYKDRELLLNVARTSLRTKLYPELADKMTESCTDAVLAITKPDEPIDLHMVEIMSMTHKLGSDSKFINGIVMDHGTRHPEMPTYLENCKILTCNVSFEYEKAEVSTGFFYSSAEEREKLVESERQFTDEKVKQVIDFKRRVCKEGESFVIINQKGIDPLSLDMFAKENIMALRRAKRRNMERLTLACGGVAMNSVDDLQEDCLGYAGKVYETSLGDDKFTFVEEVQHGKSCTILVKGPNQHTIDMIKDAIRDGLRAVKNAIDDEGVIPGAGAFEIAAYQSLMTFKDNEVEGKPKLGVQAFADALLSIPKTLAENSGFDVQDTILKVQDEHRKSNLPIGIDVTTGDCILPGDLGIWDNCRVKKQSLHLSTILASQLLLVDEVMRAGKQMGKKANPNPEEMED